ncbi:ISAzo13 family transposase [Nonomuraea zeae]|uniref:ISAzo13 family transposase n=1 Tax=Nonomuraea zeae TaxID=1642303 RepID=A0A5S4EZ75_9ACTN|nr:ISAzo13 family transposase [Nonomuraea zeae]TMR08973.1 ISAzo13 family transposase [Nonomuraea zeae]
MGFPDDVLSQLARRFDVLLPHLNERQRRLLLGQEARLLGHGGVRAVATVAGASETTVRAGVFELEAGDEPLDDGRVRHAGGGRKPIEEIDPDLIPALMALVEPDERGEPMSPLRWTTKSLRHLADELTQRGHRVSPPTVGRLLREAGFSLQGNAKTLEGKQHPDRDAQFRYINEQVKQHQAEGEPVISVDTKKREQLGRLPNPGREWRPKGDPIKVEDHSFFFTGPDVAQAIPYGIYDISANTGWVNVGIDHDTSTFAVASIRRWWQARGSLDYPNASQLLITADAGGSNSYRYRVWKAELAALAAETGLAITVCHFPPGTSKWNKIEHRLFSHVTMNWRGRPLTSHDVVVNTIASTRTRTGLRVEAELDTTSYPLGVTVSKARFAELPIHAHPTHSSWNYTIRPDQATIADQPGVVSADRAQVRAAALRALADPRLTGMTEAELGDLSRRLAPAQAARAEQRMFHQRGGGRRRAKGAGSQRLLCDADRVLITVVYLRQICSQKVLSDMLEVSDFTIGYWIAETRKLLTENQITIPATTLRFTTPAQLHVFLDNDDVPAQRPRISETLSHPALTGMSREELHQMIERLTPLQAARLERLRYERRGGERLPGARGGIFQQKITDAERILATILYQRKVCTRQALSELFEVSPRTIGNTLIDARPLLENDGYNPAPATIRYRNAAALLASISPC